MAGKQGNRDGPDPTSGSVRPKQPTSSPLASRGRYFSLSCSLPKASAANLSLAGGSPEPRGREGARTDRVHDERALHRHGRAVARVYALDFARNEAVRDGRHARAAVPVDRRPEEAQLAHLAQDGTVKVWRRRKEGSGGQLQARREGRTTDSRCGTPHGRAARDSPGSSSAPFPCKLGGQPTSLGRPDALGPPHRMLLSSSVSIVLSTLNGSSHWKGANAGVSVRPDNASASRECRVAKARRTREFRRCSSLGRQAARLERACASLARELAEGQA